MKKPSLTSAPFAFAALALAVGAGSVRASDETADTSIELKAPLTASACTATPPTISVLGLNLDITGAAGSCAALAPGSAVEVRFASDALPLDAVSIDHTGSSDSAIEAPIQAFDPVAKTVSLLGLTIDISTARLDGADDDAEDGVTQPVEIGQLSVGQFVEVKLDPARLPALVASKLEVKNFANQIEVEFEDPQGHSIFDDVDDIDVDVAVKLGPGTPAARRRTLHLRRSASGHFVLGGLPTGTALIRATRNAAGVQTAGKHTAKIKPNTRRLVVITLRRTHVQ
jgi:hypothetical protein